jgi:hypothetical protein
MTIKELTAASQREFQGIREDMATKASVEGLQDDINLLGKDMEAGFQGVTGVLKRIEEQLKDLKGMDAELTTLRIRLARVERKVGLAD